MAIDIDQSHYSTGTATVSGVNVTGFGTTFTVLRKGDQWGTHKGFGIRIAGITDDTHLTLAYEVPGLQQTAAPFEVQRTPYDLGYLQAIEDIIRLMGEGALPSLAGVDGTGGDKLIKLIGPKTAVAFDGKRVISIAALTGAGVIEFDALGNAVLVPKADLITGIDTDGKANTIAERDEKFGAQAAGFTVLVADIGVLPKRSALYFKNTATLNDWSIPAPLTGETGQAGPFTEITFGPVTTVSDTTPASANLVVIDTDTIRIDLSIPKGQDGTGTGDMTGPASAVVDGAPVLFDGVLGKKTKAGKFADKFTAEGGTNTTDFMNALGVAQAIAALSPSPSELEFTVSQLALLVADNSNIALFLGTNGNRFADSFDTLIYVDTGGATNLDTATGGALKPTVAAASLIGGATGANIGDMTALGGLAAAFDGTAAQASGACAAKLGSSSPSVPISSFLGKNYSASPRRIGSVVLYPSTDVGFIDGGGATNLTINLYASQTAPSGPTDGTLLGTTGAFADAIATKTVASSDTQTLWNYVWANVYSAIGTNIVVAECQFYTPAVANNLTVRSTAFSAASVPTKMKALLNVKKVDAAVAGADYTFECSRDNGTTWSAMVLTELYSLSTGLRVVEAAESSVTSQPSGIAPRWRFKTLNNKNVEMHDVYLYWS